jgi:hypothetical protein
VIAALDAGDGAADRQGVGGASPVASVVGSFELPQFAQLTSGSAYQINE